MTTPLPDSADPVRGVLHLADAQALPVLELDDERGPFTTFEHEDPRFITAFHALDGRTMRVVCVEGALAAQAIEA